MVPAILHCLTTGLLGLWSLLPHDTKEELRGWQQKREALGTTIYNKLHEASLIYISGGVWSESTEKFQLLHCGFSIKEIG